MIFMHHPPIKCGVLETDVDGFIGKKLLGSVISKHHHVEKIICGHIHVPINTSWNDTVISTAPSMGMQLVLDLTLKRESEFVLEAPAYHYIIGLLIKILSLMQLLQNQLTDLIYLKSRT